METCVFLIVTYSCISWPAFVWVLNMWLMWLYIKCEFVCISKCLSLLVLCFFIPLNSNPHFSEDTDEFKCIISNQFLKTSSDNINVYQVWIEKLRCVNCNNATWRWFIILVVTRLCASVLTQAFGFFLKLHLICTILEYKRGQWYDLLTTVAFLVLIK